MVLNFHAPHDARAAAYRWLAEQARDGELAVVVEQVALRDIEHAWERQRSRRRPQARGHLLTEGEGSPRTANPERPQGSSLERMAPR
jgi:hypothetical protein